MPICSPRAHSESGGSPENTECRSSAGVKQGRQHGHWPNFVAALAKIIAISLFRVALGPANAICLTNAGLMLADRLRRWANIKTALVRPLTRARRRAIPAYHISQPFISASSPPILFLAPATRNHESVWQGINSAHSQKNISAPKSALGSRQCSRVEFIGFFTGCNLDVVTHEQFLNVLYSSVFFCKNFNRNVTEIGHVDLVFALCVVEHAHSSL